MAIEGIGIVAALALTGLSLLTLVGFGIRNLFYGKQEWSSMLIVAGPIALFVVLGLTAMPWANAGILTCLIMIGLGLLALFLSSVRGLIGL